MTATLQSIALILGHSGAIGGAIARALAARGYAIRALVRKQTGNNPGHAVDWRIGDALSREAVMAAADGVDIIVHAVNPPGYARWREIGVPMLANSIAAAEATGATILFPANIYVFGPSSPAMVDERTPAIATGGKGQVRRDMETMLAEAAARGRARVIAVRAGDFFGPGVENSWFAQALAKGGARARGLRRLSAPGVGHGWAYVPDLAEAFARLCDRRTDLAPFAMLHFGGHYDATGDDLANAVRRITGRPDLPIKPFPWFTVALGAPFSAFLRGVWEMRWLWRHPLRLDNARLERLIGPEPHTPLDDAVAGALGLGPTARRPAA